MDDRWPIRWSPVGPSGYAIHLVHDDLPVAMCGQPGDARPLRSGERPGAACRNCWRMLRIVAQEGERRLIRPEGHRP